MPAEGEKQSEVKQRRTDPQQLRELRVVQENWLNRYRQIMPTTKTAIAM